MKPYLDEMILDVWHDIQAREQEADIEGSMASLTPEEWLEGIKRGVIELEDRVIQLEEKRLMEEQLYIRLPKSMQLVPRGLSQGGRKAREHDHISYSDPKLAIRFGLSLMSHSLQMGQVESFKNAMIESMKQKKQGVQWMDEKIIELNELTIGLCECILPMNQDTYYQVIFMTSLHGRALLGSFHFKLEDAALWQPLSNAIIRCLRISQTT